MPRRPSPEDDEELLRARGTQPADRGIAQRFGGRPLFSQLLQAPPVEIIQPRLAPLPPELVAPDVAPRLGPTPQWAPPPEVAPAPEIAPEAAPRTGPSTSRYVQEVPYQDPRPKPRRRRREERYLAAF